MIKKVLWTLGTVAGYAGLVVVCAVAEYDARKKKNQVGGS